MATQDSFVLMLQMQLQLQTEKMKDGSPQELGPEAAAEFIRWNVLACEDELHEAMAETGWKPWASSRHINQPQFNAEMVDAFHFFMNLLLVGNPECEPAEIVDMFTRAYIVKNAVNAQRQDEGYTGLNKCGECHRDLIEVDQIGIVQHTYDGKIIKFCSRDHLDDYERKLLNG